MVINKEPKQEGLHPNKGGDLENLMSSWVGDSFYFCPEIEGNSKMDLIVDSLDQMDHNKHLAWGTPFVPRGRGESHHKTYLANEASPFLPEHLFPQEKTLVNLA